MADLCVVVRCGQSVSKAGHTFCYKHWKAERDGGVMQCPKCRGWYESFDGDSACPTCDASSGKPAAAGTSRDMLSSTKLGERVGLSAARMNLILAELGWLEKYVKGWTPTEQGTRMGAEVREARQTGIPYTVWPASILDKQAMKRSVAEALGHDAPSEAARPEAAPVTTAPAATPSETAGASQDFRTKFPATFRTSDGHMVRSRAEVMIDNWLYAQGIVHAYERRLPIEEDVYCDFYLPNKHVYIEYWGMEKDPRYAERMAAKKQIYAKHSMSLIELGDQDITQLDDCLPRLLLKFGIDCV
ncbi:MAG: glycerol kinase [Planctomycetes bacterium]|nr:glycerol kinase [Planctomycetota bacterium]